MLNGEQQQMLDQYRSNLFGYACALARDAEQAADLFQDCMVRVISTTRPPRDDRAFRAWLFTVMRNLWIDQLRARRRRGEVQGEVEPGQETQAGRLSENVVVNRIAVRQAFARLSKDHRDVLALVDIGGFGYQETADILAIPKGTVMSRVSRARLALSQILSDDRVATLPQGARRKVNG